MITFILLCLAAALIVAAIHNQFQQPDSLVYWLPMHLDNLLVKLHLTILSKPLYECMICMSSIWGSAFFILGAALFAPKFIGLFYVLYAIPVIAGLLTIIDICSFLKEIEEKDNGTTYL